jgi:hypothetical protein
LTWLREVAPIEATRWTVVFHRESKEWFFRTIAMGHFKHVSALAWIPELSQWWIYDVGFRKTRLRVIEDGPTAQAMISAIVAGNATITIDARENELPWFRLGMFCTTGVAHLLGLGCVVLRPDALYRHLIALGGTVRDHESCRPAIDRR